MTVKYRITTTAGLGHKSINRGREGLTISVTPLGSLDTGVGGTTTMFSGSGEGGLNGGTYSNPIATNALEQYIDAAVKPDYIQNFMDDNLSDLKLKIDASHNEIITTITDFADANASAYLANFALSTIGVVHKAYLISQDHVDIVNELDKLKIECKDFLDSKNRPTTHAVLMGDLTIDTVFDMRYILYIQKHGVPPLGVFDPVKLAEFL